MAKKEMVEVIAVKTLSYECQRFEVGQPLLMAVEHVDNHVENGLVIIAEDAAPVLAGDETTDENDGEGPTLESLWKLSMDPEEYLEKYPEGPEAALARKIYEARLKA